MKKKAIVMPNFINEAQEADWWASREGREFVKKAAETRKKGGARVGSASQLEQHRVAVTQVAAVPS